MGFNYKPLWKLLIDRDMTKKMLQDQTGISKSTVDKMNHGENVSLEIIDRLCTHFDCEVEDLIKHEKGY